MSDPMPVPGLGARAIGSLFGNPSRSAQINGIVGDLLGGGVQEVFSAAAKKAAIRQAASREAWQTSSAGGLMAGGGGAPCEAVLVNAVLSFQGAGGMERANALADGVSRGS